MTGRRRVVALVAVAAAVIGLAAWLALRNGEPGPPGTLSGNGTVEATEVEVSAKVAGRLATLVPREGDAVEGGAEVASLEAAELEAHAAQARGALAAAEAALAEIEAGAREEDVRRLRAQLAAAQAGVGQAQARLDLARAGARPEQLAQLRAAVRQAEVASDDAERDRARLERLVADGAAAGRDLDQATARRDAAAAALESARQRLAEGEAGSRAEELRLAEAAVAQAQGQAAAAQAALDLALAGPRAETVRAAAARVEAARGSAAAAGALLAESRIVAPVSGRVTLRNAEPGEVVTPGFPLLRIADLSRVWLRVYVPEPQIGLVRLGQRADVTVDAFPGRSFPGLVAEIPEEPEFTPKNVQTREERVKLVFGVKIEVDNAGGELKPGMPADAVITVR